MTRSYMRILNLTLVLLTGIAAIGCTAQTESTGSPRDTASDTHERPKLSLHSDGFPTGHKTPEGVACDLARSFISRDVELFRDTCIKPFSKGESNAAYEAFLQRTAASIAEQARMDAASPGGPKSIAKVFAARHLSRNGPASTGYALFDIRDVMFVDVGVTLHNGKKFLTRTLVLKTADGDWYVHPLPRAYPLLSAGLNEEEASIKDFKEAYTVAP